MRYLFLIITLLALVSCQTQSDAVRVMGKVTDPSQRFETFRFSFLPPKGEGWNYSHNIDADIVKFTKVHRGERLVAINSITIYPSSAFYAGMSFDKLLKMQKAAVKRTNEPYNKIKDAPYETVKVVQRAGMRCVMREHFMGTPIVKDIYSAQFECEQPNQPKDLSYFHISSTFPNTQELLEPFWKSLKFKPIDRSSAQYLNSQESVKRIQAQRKKEEAEQTKNQP